MSVDLTYMDAVDLVRKAYGDGSLTWSETSTALANAGYTTENYLEFFENSSGVFDVLRNADGSIRNVTWKTAESLNSNAIAGAIDSNAQTAALSEAAQVKVPAELTLEQGATQGSFTAGLSKAGSFVFKEVAPAVGAAMAGCYAGKQIDGALYNLGEKLDLNPPWDMDPTNWSSLVSDLDESDPFYVQWAGKAFCFLLGIDANGDSTAYMDKEAILNYMLWLNEEGVFDSSEGVYAPDNLEGNMAYVSSQMEYPLFPSSDVVTTNAYVNFDTTSIPKPAGTKLWYLRTPNTLNRHFWFFTSSVAFTPPTGMTLSSFYYNSRTVYYCGDGRTNGTEHSPYNTVGPTNFYNGTYIPEENFGYIAWICEYGKQHSTPGLSDQPGATVPLLPNWETTSDVETWLDTNLPGWDEDPVTNTVPQADGSTKTYTYVPVPFVEYNQDTETNPSTGDATQPQIDPQTGKVTQPKIDPEPYPYPETLIRNVVTPITPPTWPDTGTGTTPAITPPVGTSGALFGIYNPSQAELDSFGAWLWSSNFIDQLLKIFNDPMQAIIGLHKVFVIPAVKLQTQHIMVGYLDSGVSSHVVSRQYETVDCGSVNLKEYFGNVFDYDPHTTVSIYLPFIGIQQLRTGDVMRSKLKVVYHIDVITGACLVEVKVTRDNAGGTLYTYTGNCAVQYPLSSGSYMGIVASLASIAGGIIGTVATGGAAAPLAVGAISGALNAHTNVSRSGGFSGNAGAMGIKRPYLIITRPQTNLAAFDEFQGYPANKTVQLSSCSGYVKCKECHLENLTATGDELQEIDNLLKSGILI